MALLSGDLVGTVLPSEVRARVSYRIQRLLGEGATARAFLATRHGEGVITWVVVKVVRPSLASRSGAKAALLVRKEAVALGRLNEVVPPCPFVVRFIDTGILRDQKGTSVLELPWIVLEYVHGGIEGASLEERVTYAVVQTGYAFDCERAARAIRHICEGLAEVHAAGIIHRDLTPGNVLCTGFGNEEVFKLSDFGVARPQGMNVTLNAVMLGTPGYMAPEQFELGELGNQADLFALGALAFFMLTGENYFQADTPPEALVLAQKSERRELRGSAALVPELDDDIEACSAIDDVLKRATAMNPAHRPVSARAFCEGVVPFLERRSRLAPITSRRLLEAVQKQAPQAPSKDRWVVLCPPGSDRVVRGLAWDSEGHCLAATSRGLEYWGGTEWQEVPAKDRSMVTGIRSMVRAGPGRWILGADESRIIEYSRHGALRVVSGCDTEVEIDAISGDLEDLMVVAGRTQDGVVVLCAYVRGFWLKPLPVHDAASVLSLSRIDPERWLVAGRGADGRGMVALYWPLRWELALLPVPLSRAYLATASRLECASGVAVGAGGAMVFVGVSGERSSTVPDRPDLAAAAMDVLGRTWAGAAGQLWVEMTGRGWMRVWSDRSWHVPFVGIYADIGLVTAVTADGAIIESRLTRSEIMATMMTHLGSVDPT